MPAVYWRAPGLGLAAGRPSPGQLRHDGVEEVPWEALRSVAAELGLIEEINSSVALADSGAEQHALEREIIESSGLGDTVLWHARLGERLRQVARVEVPLEADGTVTGTGFLVAPNLVLTNYHVVARILDGEAQPEAVRVRFDHAVNPGDPVPKQGTVIGLATNWLAAWRPYSAVDLKVDSGDQLPDKDELDFAFLRLASPLPDRGRVRLSRPVGKAPGLVAGDWLIILQHPGAEPLKQAFGLSLGENQNHTRLRYKVTTDEGSSGSPVLNERLDLVALHHAGDPNFEKWHTAEYNAAIPVPALLDYLELKEQDLVQELAG
jgi:Trypsin-like peptidase domain